MEAERRRIHHPYNSYYDPEVPSHEYSLSHENMFSHIVSPYKDDIVTIGRKT
jgi:hypothetical protein